MTKIKIGILTGGGDCAGLNPAVKWVVNTAVDNRLADEYGIEFEVWGIMDGWRGIINVDPSNPSSRDIIPLNSEVVRTWDRYGGTFLGTSRTNPYNAKNDQSGKVLSNIGKLGINTIVAVGGDDTLSVALKLKQEGINVVGIPKTIDKDLTETDYTLGFETALNVIVEETDRLRTTAGSHRRIFVVETMGRNAGWLALHGGEAGGAFIILIPEHDFSMKRVNELIMEGRREGSRYEIIVVAEGAKPEGCGEFCQDECLDSFGHKTLGGIGDYVAKEIARETKLECRNVALSHLQRGGAPCAYDRRMGRYFGIAAVDLAVRKDYGKMVSFKNGFITAVPLEKVIGKLNLVDVKTQYDTVRYNGRRTILTDENQTSGNK